jgi:tetratricopeptide (TPR) repeat protein
MAKEISRPPLPAAPPPVFRRWLRPAGWLLVIGDLAVGATQAWQWYRLPARLQARLPAGPDLSGKPAIQAELLAQATALTRTSRSARAGVVELGRLYHANGYAREAEACWRLLLQEEPREPHWSYFLADLRRTAGDYPELASLLGRTVQLAPDYSPAWLQLAGLELKSGHYDEAERHYRRRLALVPGDFYAVLGLARVAQHNGQPAEARRLVEQLVRDFPQISTGHNLYAEMLAASGDPEGARQQRWLGRETGRFREPEDPWLDGLQAWCYDFTRLCVLATIEQQTARGDKGVSLLERAIRLAPDNPAGYELLGGLYRKLGDPAKARDTLEAGLRAAKTAKPSPMFYVNLSETYRLLKQPVDALRIVQLGFAELGDQLELYDALGVALADLNRQEEAIVAFRAVLARNPNDTNSNYNLGMSLLVLGRQEEAYAAFQRSLIQQPTFLKALSLLGRWELEAGRLEAAGKYLQPLYESHPEIPEVRSMLARWHQLSGERAETNQDFPAALQHYREAVALDPGRAELQASLGVFYLVQGRVTDAVAPLEAYHKLQPAEPQSALFLGQAYLQLGRAAEARSMLTEGEQLARRTGQATTAAHFRELLEQL